MIASKYKANYCHYACFPPEIRKIMSKSGSWINNHLFTYTPYVCVNFWANVNYVTFASCLLSVTFMRLLASMVAEISREVSYRRQFWS